MAKPRVSRGDKRPLSPEAFGTAPSRVEDVTRDLMLD